jgi:hypothetical protein
MGDNCDVADVIHLSSRAVCLILGKGQVLFFISLRHGKRSALDVPAAFCQPAKKIMSKKKNSAKPGLFCWNELATTNVAAAKKFYAGLLGWKTQAFGGGIEYTQFKKGKDMVGGMLKSPKPGIPAHWVPYVIVDSVEATVKKAARLKGKVLMPPFDIPDVGRIAVLRDPQGAVIGIIKPG